MFVHPGQVQEIVRKHPQIERARVVVSGNIGNEEMSVLCELKVNTDTVSDLTALNAAIVQSTRDITKLRATVRFTDQNTLPVDGKVIEDARTYI